MKRPWSAAFCHHEVEAFLPTYETVRVLEKKPATRSPHPSLFPCYLFVRNQITGAGKGPRNARRVADRGQPAGNHAGFPTRRSSFLRSDLNAGKFEPYVELVCGRARPHQVGSMQGLEGTLGPARAITSALVVLSGGHDQPVTAAIEFSPEQLEGGRRLSPGSQFIVHGEETSLRD